MRRELITRGLLCFLTLVVVACQDQAVVGTRVPRDISALYVEPTADAGPTPTRSRKQVVEFWTTDNEPERVAVYQEVAGRFMRRRPDVDLRIVPIDESSLSARIATAIQADALPDIIRLGIEHAVILAADGLLDYNAAEAVIAAVGESNFRAGPLRIVTDPDTGRYIAVPYDGWLQGLWYRADLFEELGLPPPTTWEAIREGARALRSSGRLEFAIVLPTDPAHNYVHQVFEQVAISNDAWPFDEAGRVAMDTPEMVEALTWYSGLQAYAMPGPQYWRGAREAYQYGQAGMFFYSTYILEDLVEGSELEGGRKVRITVPDLARKTEMVPALIGPSRSATYGQLVTLAIMRRAPLAARDVVEFFLTEGYADVLALAPAGKVPVLESAVDEWKRSSDAFGFYPDETLDRIANGYDTMQRWMLRPDYDARERAVIGSIEGHLLIPQAIYEIAVAKTLTPRQAAERLQTAAEALRAAR